MSDSKGSSSKVPLSQDDCHLTCTSRRSRTIAGSAVVAAAFSISSRLLYVCFLGHVASRPGTVHQDATLCKHLQKVVDGSVLCDWRQITRYSFNWGNSDCEGNFPQLIVRPQNEDDVARTVQAAVNFGAVLSYRSGGHSYTCDGIKEGSVHIDLRTFQEKRLYKEDGGWVAEFGTGNTFKDLFKVIDRQRFSFIHGACYAVGVGGFYLHGGLHLNSLTSLYGWGNESILSMRVVVASGQILELSPSSDHPDLWNSFRQAGSNFGIATSLRVRVHEKPEPRMWLFWAEVPHAEALRLFYRSFDDDDVQLNIFYVNAPVFQISSNRSNTFTFQFTLLNGPVDYWANLAQSVKWFEKEGSPLTWWTIAFNAVVPKPTDLTNLGYSRPWVSSHAILRNDNTCLDEAMTTLLAFNAGVIQEHMLPSFGDVDCWLLLAKMPAGRVYYEYSCPSSPRFTAHVNEVEGRISSMCDDIIKYRNVPIKGASPEAYYPDASELLKAKARWDPDFVFGAATGSLRQLSEA